MNNTTRDKYALNNWMSATPAIDILSLAELTLPGTHNAGCDWQASYALIPGAHWLACQHDSFPAQLNNGSRVLDLRLDFDGEAIEFEKFRFQHNGVRSSRNVLGLFAAVNLFLRNNPDEFLILDFHELKDGRQSFDYALFNEMMLRYLGKRIIPADNSGLPLGVLKKISGDQRLLVAAQQHPELNPDWFCKKVEHKWSGIGDTNVKELEQHIINVLRSPPPRSTLWSLSATSYSKLNGPVDIHDELETWFDPATHHLCEKCNIINIDFIEESKLVSYCRNASLINARKAKQPQ
ncbi:phospholipase [Pseudomonas baetica]|uniref:phospholipase n=1 Tax=Pseudomonas baetica TaxID=674054 RepID=UPI002405B6A6|nr:phospholipase [Pseudomonas baetica]MDF9773387.1 1-phosphatidylinositol phosphodiesterase [Pseudomonas baetica]